MKKLLQWHFEGEFKTCLLLCFCYRILDYVSHIHRKGHMFSEELATAHKEKKKVELFLKLCLQWEYSIKRVTKLVFRCQGIFTSVFQEIAGNKAKQAPDVEIEDTRESVEQLSVIFSSSNFHGDIKIIEGSEKLVANEDKSVLDIGIHSMS